MSRELDARVAKVMGVEYTDPWSSDVSAAYRMEDWIEDNGVQARYAQAMVASFLYLDDPIPDTDEQFWWALLHATPEQRCHAFLSAVDG